MSGKRESIEHKDWAATVRKVTLEDLAVKLGVARSTVSRALRDDPQIALLTRERVQQLAVDLGYYPNAAAQALNHRRAGVVGLLLPRTSAFVFANPYFSELLHGIADVAETEGYPLLLSTSREPNYESWLREERIDGLILLGSSVRDRDIPVLDKLLAAGFPLVLIHTAPAALEAVTIGSNERQGILQALTHLAELGHRRVAFLAGPRESHYARRREEAYWSGVETLPLMKDESLRLYGDDTRSSGEARTRSLLEQDIAFDAVLANNDLIAIGACRAVRRAGLRVPEDISVVGFDDIELAAITSPPLTTIHQPVKRIGEMAMKALLRLMTGDREVESVLLDTRLVLRGSTAPRQGST